MVRGYGQIAFLAHCLHERSSRTAENARKRPSLLSVRIPRMYRHASQIQRTEEPEEVSGGHGELAGKLCDLEQAASLTS